MKTKVTTFRAAFLGSAALVALTCSAPGFAQVQEEQPAPQEDASATDTDATEIVVTATKREEKILDIPQSVSVVSGDTLERQQATTFQEYANLVPGLSVTESEPGEARLILRGVNTGGVASTVAVYVDEIPFGSSSGLVNAAELAGDFDTFDLARIEVLRGPQGTLYGANSLGGLLKFVTNTPKLGKFSARARAGLEWVDDGGMGHNANAVVNIPLGEIAAFRASGFYRKDSGWIDAVETPILTGFVLPPAPGEDPLSSLADKNINDNKSFGGRGSLLVKPIDPLTIRLTAVVQNIKTNASSQAEVEKGSYDPIGDDERQTVIFPEDGKFRYRLYNGTVEYDLGFASLVSATGFGRNKQTFRTDLTLAIAPALNFLLGPSSDGSFGLPQVTLEPIGVFQDQLTDLKKFTQEIRLASPSNDTLEWLVGGYYTKERGTIDQFIGGVNLNTGSSFVTADFINPAFEPIFGPILNDVAVATVESKYREFAGFANFTWHVTDRFDLTAGGRWSKNKQTAEQTSVSALFGSTGPTGAKSSEDVFTYSISPRLELNDNTAIYGRLAKGYRPGGPNVVPAGAPPEFPETYKADTITSYEVGLKTDVGRQLSIDVAAFYLDWQDIQLFSSLGVYNFNANGGQAESQGFEGTVSWRPMRGLNLSANGAYVDAQLTEDTDPVVGGRSGDRLPYTPKFSFGLNGDYEWTVGAATTAFVGGSLRYVGKQHAGFRPAVATPSGFNFIDQRRIPSYAQLDLRAGAELGRFTIEAFARNVTNTRGVTSVTDLEQELLGGNALPNGGVLAGLTQPRTIGFTVGVEF